MDLSRMTTRQLRDRIAELEIQKAQIQTELEALQRLQQILQNSSK